MDELLEQFLIEGRDLVAEAHRALLALGRAPGDRASLDGLFRATHTLKGSVAVFDMAPAERLLHAAESRLEAARKGEAKLDTAILAALVAVIDQTDRWIDAMEQAGCLDVGAPATAERLLVMLGEEQVSAVPAASSETDQGRTEVAWLTTLLSRPRFAEIDREQALTAFRYVPDPDCFFRGEDPLALASTVPGLLALAVLPIGDTWPALSECEPFRCMSAIEGLSAADPANVRTAFRLVPDQIHIAPVLRQASRAMTDVSAAHPRETAATVRVDTEKLDQLADRSGELGVAIRALEPLAERLRAINPMFAAELRAAREEIERAAGAIQRSVAQVRLVSLESTLRRLPRLAREAARSSDKSIRMTLTGETTPVDKQIADQLFEPLLHLVRNAVDHGIETTAERLSAGKPAEGHIRLSITHRSDMIEVALEDDGRGIDAARIREVAIATGLVSREAAAALADDDARQLIFAPGFSTAPTATILSGRGVGMDAVRASINRLGGSILIDSAVDEGTCFTLLLPANAMTTPLLVVEAGGQKLGLRLDQVVETARVAANAIQPVGHGKACILRDATVPVLDLAGRLGLGDAQGDQARLIIVNAGNGNTALRVSRFGDRIDAMVKPDAGLLARLPAISGTTMMADGSVLLVLDLVELIS